MFTFNELQEELQELGYRLTASTDFTASLVRLSNRAKLGYKDVFHYRFKSEEKRTEYVNKWLENFKQSQANKIKRKEQAKKDKEQAIKNIKEGDIFCYSWGWEQTNVSFYQLISRKGKSSAVVREIALESVEECSWASDYVKPLKDNFISGEETVRLSGDYFKRPHGYASLIGDTKKFYRSWYA